MLQSLFSPQGMGASQSNLPLSHEENIKMRELSVYCALLMTLSHNSTTRNLHIEGVSPKEIALRTLESQRSKENSSRREGAYDA